MKIRSVFLLKILFSILIILVVMFIHSINSWRQQQLQDYENNSSAFVILSKGTTPLTVEVHAQDLTGKPLSGASVDIRNNSGGNAAVCDGDGNASIRVGETDIEQIILGDKLVLNRPKAYELGYPSVEHGICVLIIYKGKNGMPAK